MLSWFYLFGFHCRGPDPNCRCASWLRWRLFGFVCFKNKDPANKKTKPCGFPLGFVLKPTNMGFPEKQDPRFSHFGNLWFPTCGNPLGHLAVLHPEPMRQVASGFLGTRLFWLARGGPPKEHMAPLGHGLFEIQIG